MKALRGPARREGRIQPLDVGGQGIGAIIQAAVGVDSRGDGDEAGVRRYALPGVCLDRQHPHGAGTPTVQTRLPQAPREHRGGFYNKEAGPRSMIAVRKRAAL